VDGEQFFLNGYRLRARVVRQRRRRGQDFFAIIAAFVLIAFARQFRMPALFRRRSRDDSFADCAMIKNLKNALISSSPDRSSL
jgi:hypothetical protein